MYYYYSAEKLFVCECGFSWCCLSQFDGNESRISLSYKIRWPNVGHGRSLCGGPSDFSHHDGVRECLTLHLEVLVLGSWEAAEPPSHWRLSALG